MKKNVFIIICFILGASSPIFSFYKYNAIGAVASGLGHNSVTLPDLWSVVNNQSGMVFLEKPMVGMTYEERFQIKELGVKSLAGVYPTKEYGAFGACVMHTGDDVYSEMRATVGYAMRLGANFSVGVAFDYWGISVTGDTEGTSGGTVTGAIGAMGKVYENLWLSVHLYNPFAVKLKQNNLEERLPVLFCFGMRYHFSKQTFAVVEIEKDTAYKARVKCGVSYSPLKKIDLRVGIATNPIVYSLGVGYSLSHFTINASFYKHRYLGYTPSLGVRYTF